MKILILSQWFQPEPTFKGLPLAKAFRDHGHAVEVLTGFPNYPGGKLYPGYRIRPWSREVMDGIRVNRVPLYPSHDRSGLRRMVNYLSFSASAASLGPWLVDKPDLIYVYNLVTLGPAAGFLRQLTGSKVVLDVQDLWPESVANSGLLRSRSLLHILDYWCKAVYSSVDRLIVLSPGFKRNLIARGISAHKIDVIYNWCDDAAMNIPEPDPVFAQQRGFAGRFNVLFAGNMGVMQALDTVIEAARKLQGIAPEVLFTFIGGGVEADRLGQVGRGLPNVQFIPPVPRSKIGQFLVLADALLVHLKDDPLFEITIPSKVQAYLCAGRPILCGLKGDAADLVRRADAGVLFRPEDPTSLIEAVLALRSAGPHGRIRMGENGRAYYQHHLTFERGVSLLEQSFAKALSRQS